MGCSALDPLVYVYSRPTGADIGTYGQSPFSNPALTEGGEIPISERYFSPGKERVLPGDTLNNLIQWLQGVG